MIGHEFPYMDTRDINLDWLLKTVKSLKHQWETFTPEIQDYVNKWLDDHPEATTTVQDGSLTYEKFVLGTLGYVTPQMFGAKADGVTDDTAAVQAAVDSDYDVFIPDGMYMINAEMSSISAAGGVLIPSNKRVLLSKNAILKAIPNGSQYYSVLQIADGENVDISGGYIIGDRNEHNYTGGGSHEWGYGILIRSNSKHVNIHNMNIAECTGDAIIASKITWAEGIPENINISNCRLYNNRRQGISITDCFHFTIADNEIYNISGTAPADGIDLEPNAFDSFRIRYGTIKNNYIHDCGVYRRRNYCI